MNIVNSIQKSTAERAEKVLCRLASVCYAVCVCVRRISLGGEGNVLFPVLSSYSSIRYTTNH